MGQIAKRIQETAEFFHRLILYGGNPIYATVRVEVGIFHEMPMRPHADYDNADVVSARPLFPGSEWSVLVAASLIQLVQQPIDLILRHDRAASIFETAEKCIC